jgi:hypothetical protein
MKVAPKWIPCALILALAAITPATPAHAASDTAGPLWSTSGTAAHGCPSTLHVLKPGRSTSYFQAHPQDLLVSRAAGSSDMGLLRQVADHQNHWLTSVTCTPGHPGRPAPRRASSPTSSSTTYESSNWSGYVSDSKYYVGAAMEWPLHSIANTTNVNAYSSTWPGIGTGENTEDTLVQAGVQQELPCSVAQGQRSCGSQTNTFWVELYPQEAEIDVDLAASTSDLVAVIVEYDDVNGIAYWELDNLTTGNSLYLYQELTADSSGVVGSGSQVEWIVERPGICFIVCNTYPLPNFGTQPITSAQAGTGSINDMTVTDAKNTSPDTYNMYDCSFKTQLDSTQAFTSSTSFNVKWSAYGTVC